MSALAQIESKLKNAPSLKAALQENFVEERFITNFEAVTGRKDGKTKFQSTFLSYMERIAEKSDLMNANRFSHFAAIVKIGRMGLPLEKLYIMPDGHGGIKVQSDPAGKRAQLEMMAEIKSVPEPQYVLKGDTFIHDKLNNVIVKHETTDKTVQELKLENIVASYCRIKYTNGEIIDVVVPNADLVKARAKSAAKSDQSFWATYPGEAAKKVAINRAHRLYHKYPDTVLTFDDDKEEDTVDAGYEEAPEDFVATTEGAPVDEGKQESEEVPTEDFDKAKATKKDKKEGEDFIV